MSKPYSDFPKEIKQSCRPDALSYSLNEELVALRGAAPERLKANILYTLGDGGITVWMRNQVHLAGSAEILPVYASKNTTAIAVATGLIFVRFEEGIPASACEQAIAQAGYRISALPGYAPHAVWLKNHVDDVGCALSNIAKLIALPDVAHVEPQLLMPVSTRGITPRPR